MLIIDNKELRLNDENPKGHEKTVIDKIKAIKAEFKGRFPLKFTYVDSMLTEATMVDNSFKNPNKITVYPKRSIKTTIDVIIDGVRMKMVYTTPKNWKYNEKRKAYESTLKSIKDKKGFFTVEEHDADLAFFLFYAHPHFADIFECKEIQRIQKNKGDVFYKFIDNERNASTLILKEAAKVKVQNLIYNEIGGDIIKKLAILYKVDRYEMLQPNELKVTLLSKVISKAENSESYQNIYAEFESDYLKLKANAKTNTPHVKQEGEVELKGLDLDLDNDKGGDDNKGGETDKDNPEFKIEVRELVDKALKENVVKEIGKTSTTASRKYWVYVREDGKQGTKIVNIIHDDPKDDLVGYLCEEDEVRKGIKTLIKNKVIDKE